jgi:hypothetical protein
MVLGCRTLHFLEKLFQFISLARSTKPILSGELAWLNSRGAKKLSATISESKIMI